MIMEKQRLEIIEYGIRLLRTGLTNGTSGNLSMYDPETGYMAITPSGIGYEETRPEDIVIVTLDGERVDGERKPSSELDLHASLYRMKPHARAVVHAHSMACTTLACLREPIRPIHFLLPCFGMSEVPVAPYVTFGTRELADSVAKTIGDGDACLMANHGVICCGAGMAGAFGLLETCEWCAELQWRCMCAGRPAVLSDEEVQKAVARFAGYGQ
ncbi:MAG: class II aldolase/adducin family protein [Lachnospiraceae bacterium]|nr:class II aldolase/adducin family protein [Lachnospiraceae bacterium]